MKKVSVIVPCYNAEKVIDRCLSALVNQTLGLEDLEIILVNDASTDGTIQKLRSWEQKYPDSILLIDSTVNMKTGGARNLGIQYANGEYIGFVDNDDWVDATMYEKAYEAARKYDCDVVSVLYAREREDGYRLPLAMPEGQKNIFVDATKPLPEGVASLPGEVWSKIYRRSLIVENELYFPEGLSYPENYWLPLVRYYIQSYYVVDEILYHYIQYNQSIIMTGNYNDLLDRLEIEIRLLQELEKRGLAAVDPDRVEKKFIECYYVNTLYLSFARKQSSLPCEIYHEMKEEVLSRYPRYYENQEIRKLCRDNGVAFLLRTLEVEMTDDLWHQLSIEYMNRHYDLSIFLKAEKDKRVSGSLESRELFKLGYLLFCEMRGIVSEFQQILASDSAKRVWDRYEALLKQRFGEAEVISEALTGYYKLEWEPYRMDTIKQIWEEAASCFREGKMEAISCTLQKLEQYLELPESLYKEVWCKGDLSPLQCMPALEFCFLHTEEPDLLEHARKIIFDGRSPLFSFKYQEKPYYTELDFDSEVNMFYFMQNGIRLYFPRDTASTIAEAGHIAYQLLVEQDPRSPHRYFNERMCVNEGDIVIDAGVAEGNFSASVIQKCSKLYMIECDPNYVEALKISFRDYLDKIVFVDKFLDGYDDETHITLDTLLQGETVHYIKMDIEGAEIASLQGGKQTLKNSLNLKCNICAYHNLHDYEQIVSILSEYGMEIAHSPGWLFFPFDKEYPNYPRRGLVQAVKKNQ